VNHAETQGGPGRHTRNLEIAGELMRAMDDATRSGQGHLMHRVLEILRSEALSPDLQSALPEREVIMGELAELEHEAARLAPDPASFKRGAQLVMDALGS
jgi:hypothetical protein